MAGRAVARGTAVVWGCAASGCTAVSCRSACLLLLQAQPPLSWNLQNIFFFFFPPVFGNYFSFPPLPLPCAHSMLSSTDRELAAGSQYFVRTGIAQSLRQGWKPSDLSSAFLRGEITEAFAEMTLKWCIVVCLF